MKGKHSLWQSFHSVQAQQVEGAHLHIEPYFFQTVHLNLMREIIHCIAGLIGFIEVQVESNICKIGGDSF